MMLTIADKVKEEEAMVEEEVLGKVMVNKLHQRRAFTVENKVT